MDIGSGTGYPSAALSNFAPHSYRYRNDGNPRFQSGEEIVPFLKFLLFSFSLLTSLNLYDIYNYED